MAPRVNNESRMISFLVVASLLNVVVFFLVEAAWPAFFPESRDE